MQAMTQLVLVLVSLSAAIVNAAADGETRVHHHRKGHHHHHHHHRHHHHHHGRHTANATASQGENKTGAHNATGAKAVLFKALSSAAAAKSNTSVKKVLPTTEKEVLDKVKQLEVSLKKAKETAFSDGSIYVNGPLPADFAARFAQAVSESTGSNQHSVLVTKESSVAGQPGIMEIAFRAPGQVVEAVQTQAADPDSKLSAGQLRYFLVARRNPEAGAEPDTSQEPAPVMTPLEETAPVPQEPAPVPQHEVAVAPPSSSGIDIDTQMPYGDLEPFGREDTAQELTEQSVKESDEMVDQLERAEVAEEKRAVFRALTRLRGAAITSFDGIARSQTGNIDEYNKVHKWRNTHPLHHLADEESDITKWAFPDNADF